MSDVFISYSRKDESKARALAALLEARGLTVFWDRRLPAGQSYPEVLQREVDEARAVCVLWSGTSITRSWVRAEASRANNRGCLVPVLLERVEPPMEFALLQAIDLSSWDGAGSHPELQTLRLALSGLLEAEPVADRSSAGAVARVEVTSRPEHMPVLIVTDVEGCITPYDRGVLDLRQVMRLRAYCDFCAQHPDYPPLVMVTGRSQGYVELLAQALGILDSAVPSVIENGSALYFPREKTTRSLVSPAHLELIHDVRLVLLRELGDREFEPKSFMITINNAPAETVEELKERVVAILGPERRRHLSITSTATAVDVTPGGINKLAGLERVFELLPERLRRDVPRRVVACGDSISDLPILRVVGRGNAYCPSQEVSQSLPGLVRDLGGTVLPERNVRFVIGAIERACGLRIA